MSSIHFHLFLDAVLEVVLGGARITDDLFRKLKFEKNKKNNSNKLNMLL